MTTPSTPDLGARILAAIERAERIARAAEGDHVFDGTGIVIQHHHDPALRRNAMLSSTVAIHIATNRPATVLRHCAADRQLVQWYRTVTESAAIHMDAKTVVEELLMERAHAYGVTEDGGKVTDDPICPSLGRPLTDDEVCDIAVASGWIEDTPEARAAYLAGEE